MGHTVLAVHRRPVGAGDRDLLRELFAGSRDDLDLLPADVRSAMVDLQQRAQEQQYAAAYPHARHAILAVDGIDVGRLVLDHAGDGVHVVDVSVLAAHRDRGIGTSVLTDVIDEAAGAARPVRLQVWAGNHRARRLYERLGFVVTGEAGGYLHMARDTSPERH